MVGFLICDYVTFDLVFGCCFLGINHGLFHAFDTTCYTSGTLGFALEHDPWPIFRQGF